MKQQNNKDTAQFQKNISTTKMHKKPYSQKSLFTLIIVVSGIIVIGVGWYIYATKKSNNQQNDNTVIDAYQKQQAISTAIDASRNVSSKAQAYTNKKDLAGLQKLYTTEINANQNKPDVLAMLYYDYSIHLGVLQQTQLSLDSAIKAYEYDTRQLYSASLLPTIGYTAYKLGDMQTAKEFIQKAYDYQLAHQDTLEPGVLNETKEFLDRLAAQ